MAMALSESRKKRLVALTPLAEFTQEELLELAKLNERQFNDYIEYVTTCIAAAEDVGFTRAWAFRLSRNIDLTFAPHEELKVLVSYPEELISKIAFQEDFTKDDIERLSIPQINILLNFIEVNRKMHNYIIDRFLLKHPLVRKTRNGYDFLPLIKAPTFIV